MPLPHEDAAVSPAAEPNRVARTLAHLQAAMNRRSPPAILSVRHSKDRQLKVTQKRARTPTGTAEDNAILISSDSEHEAKPEAVTRRVRARIGSQTDSKRSSAASEPGSGEVMLVAAGTTTAPKAAVDRPGTGNGQALQPPDAKGKSVSTAPKEDTVAGEELLATLQKKLGAEQKYSTELAERLHKKNIRLGEVNGTLWVARQQITNANAKLAAAETEAQRLQDHITEAEAELTATKTKLAATVLAHQELSTSTTRMNTAIDELDACQICYDTTKNPHWTACGHGPWDPICLWQYLKQRPRHDGGDFKEPPRCPTCREVILSKPLRIFAMASLSALRGDAQHVVTVHGYDPSWADKTQWGLDWPGGGDADANLDDADADADADALPAGFVPAAAAPDDPRDADYAPSDASDAGSGDSEADSTDSSSDSDDAASDDDEDVLPAAEWPIAPDAARDHSGVPMPFQAPLSRFNRWQVVRDLGVAQRIVDLLTGGRDELRWDNGYARLRQLQIERRGDEEDRLEAELAAECRRSRLQRLQAHLPRLAAGFAYDRGDADLVHAAPLTDDQLDLLTGNEEELLLTVRRNTYAEIADRVLLGQMHDAVGVRVRTRLEILMPYLPLLDLDAMRVLPPYIRRDRQGVLHLVNI